MGKKEEEEQAFWKQQAKEEQKEKEKQVAKELEQSKSEKVNPITPPAVSQQTNLDDVFGFSSSSPVKKKQVNADDIFSGLSSNSPAKKKDGIFSSKPKSPATKKSSDPFDDMFSPAKSPAKTSNTKK